MAYLSSDKPLVVLLLRVGVFNLIKILGLILIGIDVPTQTDCAMPCAFRLSVRGNRPNGGTRRIRKPVYAVAAFFFVLSIAPAYRRCETNDDDHNNIKMCDIWQTWPATEEIRTRQYNRTTNKSTKQTDTRFQAAFRSLSLPVCLVQWTSGKVKQRERARETEWMKEKCTRRHKKREQNINNVTIAITTSGCFCCAAMFGMVNDDDDDVEVADGTKYAQKAHCDREGERASGILETVLHHMQQLKMLLASPQSPFFPSVVREFIFPLQICLNVRLFYVSRP